MAARLWLACAPLERQHAPGGHHAPVRNAISHPARRFLSKNVGHRVLLAGRLESFRLRVSWDVSWCAGGYGDTGAHVQARSSTPVGEQNTRQERVYCIPIGCSERTNKENHAEVAPPPPAKNRPSAVRTSPSTRTPPSPARALPHRAPPHRTRRTQRRQQQPGPTCPARARVVVGRTARQSPPSHAPASQARPRPRHFAASAAL